MNSIMAIAPLAVFMTAALGVSVYARRRVRTQGADSFVSEYFIGGRSMGAFVLAMTTIATYGSVSSFVGGPGKAWDVGWGWVYMAAVQVTSLFMLYGIMGKKMALVSRRVNAVTVIDVIRARYGSEPLAWISAIVIVVFFGTTMIAQFVGGARLFAAVTGYSYVAGLALFGAIVVLFTTIGGFRGVAITDALCGVAMLVGIAVLAGGLLWAGGGWDGLMATIEANHPHMMEPLAGGKMPVGLYFTQWLIVGVFTFCLPQSVVRTLGFKDARSLRRALVLGTVIIGAMMIGCTALGTMSAGVLTEGIDAYGGSIDNIIPQAIVQTLPPWLAGVAIVGPLAASVSTISSLLIAASSAIVRDLWMHARQRSGAPASERSARMFSQLATLVVGAVVFVLAITPPDVIWKINMFAFGGLETAFCWVLVAGLFWKRASAGGALLSMVGGVTAYCATMAAGISVAGLHQITIGLSVALVLMIAGSALLPGKYRGHLPVFFGIPETAAGDASVQKG
ncbi:sodium/pantothenate symporter [Eggerthellaceae bacterium zg-1084]|uniref:sodium/pantothenate symporter n=1 Tax=Berryella wangjianweii TaxID=2734634 RepID=UPI00155282DC|nr:sodium/pantothenate symporter [Berryella wangjianweii]NPD30814.1 sodium/pantothenate symporter [Berryella wangjianweii]NPD31681.1 sodium/pantothenate symporter [Eggerthellaceae bacterium zg-997]